MFTKYLGQHNNAEAEWVHEVLDMHGGGQKLAFEAVMAAMAAPSDFKDKTPFEQCVEAACVASRFWWFDGLRRLKQLGILARVDLLLPTDQHKKFYLECNLYPLWAALQELCSTAGDLVCPACGEKYRRHALMPASECLATLAQRGVERKPASPAAEATT